jgi:zinc transport system substrate-binding protein
MGNEPLNIMVSIPPQKYFVKKIAHELANISVMVSPEFNPATYEPTPNQMKIAATAKIYFAIGVPFENVWLKKLASLNPKMQIVHTDEAVTKRQVRRWRLDRMANLHETPENNKKSFPKKGALDPHVWLSPPLVKSQVKIIADALIKIDPQNKKAYEINLDMFQSELDQLDLQLMEIFKKNYPRREILVLHPCWGYFADTYGLKQIAVENEGKEPGATRMAKLINHAKLQKIKYLFVQPQFSKKAAHIIAKEIGAQILIADPLKEAWAENLKNVAVEFSKALK